MIVVRLCLGEPKWKSSLGNGQQGQSYSGYATGNPLDILAIAALSTPTESYKSGPSRSVGIVNQPVPGPSVGIPSRPGGRVSGTGMGVLGDESGRRSGQSQKLASINPTRTAESSLSSSDLGGLRLGVQRPADSVRERLSGPHDHTVVEDHSGTSPTTSTTVIEYPNSGLSDGVPGELETSGSVGARSALEAEGVYSGEDSSIDLLASETESEETNSDLTEHSSSVHIGDELRQASMGAEVDDIHPASRREDHRGDRRAASDSVSPLSSVDEFYFEDLLKWFEDSTGDGSSEFDKI
ncbi:hypothetical protein FOZ62_029305 [Perkinsus olseni]|uniref:Uncharacterized protein n=1 Tax=Perkinsus olseni TaxID=32597 RepID=A0A7J6R5A8_PEROL|nr:hypothetical protein FOZ62_029305 [Perkinsus olseni]